MFVLGAAGTVGTNLVINDGIPNVLREVAHHLYDVFLVFLVSTCVRLLVQLILNPLNDSKIGGFDVGTRS